jgi:hypothetical protein
MVTFEYLDLARCNQIHGARQGCEYKGDVMNVNDFTWLENKFKAWIGV